MVAAKKFVEPNIVDGHMGTAPPVWQISGPEKANTTI